MSPTLVMAALDFNPRPPCGGRRGRARKCDCTPRFQSTSSVWRTTIAYKCFGLHSQNFNPRPPCGGRRLMPRPAGRGTIISIHVLRVEDDLQPPVLPSPPCPFQSTSSVWRTTGLCSAAGGRPWHFNPRPPCGGRQHATLYKKFSRTISIHVLRVEDDLTPLQKREAPTLYFNPRPPCGGRLACSSGNVNLRQNFNPRPPCGGRPYRPLSLLGQRNFNPRPPCGGRLAHIRGKLRNKPDFNPRPPCGGRPRHCDAYARTGRISIHVLRVEDDSAVFNHCFFSSYFNPRPPCGGRPFFSPSSLGSAAFQSTSSVWRTTGKEARYMLWRDISIHVLRVEDDQIAKISAVDENDFNPRPPCGGRRKPAKTGASCGRFQSTSSVWRTTIVIVAPSCFSRWISIHVLRVEDDSVEAAGNSRASYFNPRPPCGGRQESGKSRAQLFLISIHVLRVEDDSGRQGRESPLLYFNPRPPCGGRHAATCLAFFLTGFQSTSSVWRTTFGLHCK